MTPATAADTIAQVRAYLIDPLRGPVGRQIANELAPVETLLLNQARAAAATPEDRERAFARLRATIEWMSNDLGEHARAIELDAAVHALDTPDAGVRVAGARAQDSIDLSTALGVQPGELHWHELMNKVRELTEAGR